MKIKDLIDDIDELKPNKYTVDNKLKWLSACEQKLIDSIWKNRQIPQEARETLEDFHGYDSNDMNTHLIAPDNYCDLYRYYIYAMIDATNGETKRYEGSMQLYNMMLKDYADVVNKTHMPIQHHMRW